MLVRLSQLRELVQSRQLVNLIRRRPSRGLHESDGCGRVVGLIARAMVFLEQRCWRQWRDEGTICNPATSAVNVNVTSDLAFPSSFASDSAVLSKMIPIQPLKRGHIQVRPHLAEARHLRQTRLRRRLEP